MNVTSKPVVIRIDQPGISTLQDLGRHGHANEGISANGAADVHAATVANTLVGNAPDAPTIEVTGSTLRFTVGGPVLMAVTGAVGYFLVDGHRQPSWEVYAINTPCTIEIPTPTTGFRSYIAFLGELEPDAPRVFGSVSPDRLFGIGHGFVFGEELTLRSSFDGLSNPFFGSAFFRLGARCPHAEGGERTIEVTVGPDATQFEGDLSTDSLCFEVSPQSDHIGLRMSGRVPERSGSGEILSRGVPVGAVEVPPQGGLLVLMRGRLVTAGYPVIAVATTLSIDRLAQIRPGATVQFRTVDLATAVSQLRKRHAELIELANRVAAAFGVLGVGRLISSGHISAESSRVS